MNKIKITIDTNIWCSATIGGIIGHRLPQILTNQNISIFFCKETMAEYDDVTNRPKNEKFFTSVRVNNTKILIDTFAEFVPILSPIILISRDPKDDHLLALSKDYDLDYLITGDKDLLVLKTYDKTRIITFSEFIEIIEK